MHGRSFESRAFWHPSPRSLWDSPDTSASIRRETPLISYVMEALEDQQYRSSRSVSPNGAPTSCNWRLAMAMCLGPWLPHSYAALAAAIRVESGVVEKQRHLGRQVAPSVALLVL